MQKYMKINVGKTVPEMMKVDHALEHDAVKRLNRGIALATEKGDNGTRALFERILVSEEEHIDWLEAQLQQIKDLGDRELPGPADRARGARWPLRRSTHALPDDAEGLPVRQRQPVALERRRPQLVGAEVARARGSPRRDG